LRAKGFKEDAKNLEPNKALYLKFDGSFNGVMTHKIDFNKPNKKNIYLQKKTTKKL
jgi:hypothetical protein